MGNTSLRLMPISTISSRNDTRISSSPSDHGRRDFRATCVGGDRAAWHVRLARHVDGPDNGTTS